MKDLKIYKNRINELFLTKIKIKNNFFRWD